VLTEVFHLIHARSLSMEKAWKFVRSGAIALSPMSDSDLPELHRLMAQYADRPMDFADATLVHLATQERFSLIVTVDHDDFETYRLPGRKRFTIWPPRVRGSHYFPFKALHHWMRPHFLSTPNHPSLGRFR